MFAFSVLLVWFVVVLVVVDAFFVVVGCFRLWGGAAGGIFFSRFLLPLRQSMFEQACSFKSDFSYFDWVWGIN